jgi:UDP:flavonoid glycosyltransferase YjiC (YdhE family)
MLLTPSTPAAYPQVISRILASFRVLRFDGRDQFEVARRVEVARCGTRLTAKKLSPAGLKVQVLETMSMTTGAQRVADEFKATGGVVRGADLIERRLLGAQP